MKGFYDQILPNIVEKIGKKYGVKVKEGEINSKYILKNKYEITARGGDTLEKANQQLNYRSNREDWKVEKENNPVKYFDIPEKMKQDVLKKGFALFSNPLPIPTQREK